MSVHDLPKGVYPAIRDYLMANNKAKNAEEVEALMMTMTTLELFDAYLIWNGIQGYTDDIIAAYYGLKALEAEKEKAEMVQIMDELRAYAFRKGRFWRSELNVSWVYGYDHGPILQKARNTLGPDWLMKVKL